MINLTLTTMALLYILNTAVIQAQEEPIEISPFIGKKLDNVERDYFYLLPKIEGFHEAIFYLNPDSSLKVNIQFKDEGILRDTVLNQYKSLSRVQNHILQVIESYISDVEPNERGKYCNVFLVDSSEFSGELLAVRQQSVLIYPFDQKTYEDAMNPFKVRNQFNEQNPSNLYSFNEKEITNVYFKEKSKIWSIIYPIIGVTVGAIVGYNIAHKHKIENPKLFAEPVEDFTGILVGSLLGAIASIPLVIFLPIETTSEKIIETPFNDEELEGLRNKSRYKDELPYYLSKIK